MHRKLWKNLTFSGLLMALSNIATTRLLAKLPVSVRTVEIAADVIACHPDDVGLVRQSLAYQPHIIYFLDRNMRASEVALNNGGQSMWVIHHPTGQTVPFAKAGDVHTTTTATAANLGKVTLEHNAYITTNGAYAEGFSADAPGDTSFMAGMEGQYAFGPSRVRCEYTMITKIVHVVTGETGYLPPGPMPLTNAYNTVKFDTNSFDGVELGTWSKLTINSFGAGWGNYPTSSYNIAETSKGTAGGTVVPSTERFRVPGRYQNGRLTGYAQTTAIPADTVRKVNWVLIAGPSVCDYAEFYPGGFAWVAATYGALAQRMEAVMLKIPLSAPDKSAVVENIAAMKAASDSWIVLFKGSTHTNPLDMWPEAVSIRNQLQTQSAALGAAIGTEYTTAMAEWNSGVWKVTACSGSVSNAQAAKALTGTGVVTVKLSARDKVHLSDGSGTLEFDLFSVKGIINYYRLQNREITILPSGFDVGLNTIEQSAWSGVKIAATSPPTSLTSGSLSMSGDTGVLGESMCATLFDKNRVAAKEESVIHPFLSPQYFWTAINR